MSRRLLALAPSALPPQRTSTHEGAGTGNQRLLTLALGDLADHNGRARVYWGVDCRCSACAIAVPRGRLRVFLCVSSAHPAHSAFELLGNAEDAEIRREPQRRSIASL